MSQERPSRRAKRQRLESKFVDVDGDEEGFEDSEDSWSEAKDLSSEDGFFSSSSSSSSEPSSESDGDGSEDGKRRRRNRNEPRSMGSRQQRPKRFTAPFRAQSRDGNSNDESQGSTGSKDAARRKRKAQSPPKELIIVADNEEGDGDACVSCGNGDSVPDNLIVYCDACDHGFHQNCHNPKIPQSVTLNESETWFCFLCRPSKERPHRMTRDSPIGTDSESHPRAQRPSRQKQNSHAGGDGEDQVDSRSRSKPRLSPSSSSSSSIDGSKDAVVVKRYRKSKPTNETDNIEVQCICNKDTQTGAMVQCSDCGTWQHCDCIRLRDPTQVPGRYRCMFCKKNDLQQKYGIPSFSENASDSEIENNHQQASEDNDNDEENDPGVLLGSSNFAPVVTESQPLKKSQKSMVKVPSPSPPPIKPSTSPVPAHAPAPSLVPPPSVPTVDSLPTPQSTNQAPIPATAPVPAPTTVSTPTPTTPPTPAPVPAPALASAPTPTPTQAPAPAPVPAPVAVSITPSPVTLPFTVPPKPAAGSNSPAQQSSIIPGLLNPVALAKPESLTPNKHLRKIQPKPSPKKEAQPEANGPKLPILCSKPSSDQSLQALRPGLFLPSPPSPQAPLHTLSYPSSIQPNPRTLTLPSVFSISPVQSQLLPPRETPSLPLLAPIQQFPVLSNISSYPVLSHLGAPQASAAPAPVPISNPVPPSVPTTAPTPVQAPTPTSTPAPAVPLPALLSLRPHLGVKQLPAFSQAEIQNSPEKGKNEEKALALGLSDEEDDSDEEQKVAEIKPKGLEKIPKLSRKVSANSVLDVLETTKGEIDLLVTKIGLSESVRKHAMDYIKQLIDKNALKGVNLVAMSCACVLIACRKESVPTTFKEICSVSRVTKKEVGRCSKAVLKVLDTSMEPITADSFLGRFCASLGFSEDLTELSVLVAKTACDIGGVAGRCPLSIAAASLYMVSLAAGRHDDRKRIAELVGIAEVTISSSYKIMHGYRHKLFPPGTRYKSVPLRVDLLPF